MSTRVVVVGAGLAGLSCAVFLSRKGACVELFEAAGHAGGRCRSYFDETLGCRIDNGNHLLLSGNRSAFEYLNEIGAADSLAGPDIAEFPFFDLETGERWVVRPNRGRIPWWILAKNRRVPGTRAAEYLRGISLARAGGDRTAADVLGGSGELYRKFWEPFGLAVMNTALEEAAASLLWPVVRETLGKGEQAYRFRIARDGLSESFVDPALDYLAHRNLPVAFGRRLRGLEIEDGRVAALDFGDSRISLGLRDRLVLAVPPATCRSLVPEIRAPDAFRAIVNVHFRIEAKRTEPAITGLVGGVSQWVIVRGGTVSVTVSAAQSLAETPSVDIAARVWAEVSRALGMERDPLPPCRVVKEKRATFAQTPDQIRRRPETRTGWSNLFLAGDWTATGLPATIEGSVRSGMKAAEAVLRT